MRFILLVAAIAASLSLAAPALAAKPIKTETRHLPNGDTVTMTLEGPSTSSGPVAMAVCGQTYRQATIKYVNYIGITLWTWGAYVQWSYCNYQITDVYWTGWNLDTCCNWGYRGETNHWGVWGQNRSSITIFEQGSYAYCVPWPYGCTWRQPFARVTVNANGNYSNLTWGN